ncbi:MAG: BACON domain-containing protein [Prevotellaceae bacterium]|jgi:hypothetical protein|nr:BACON domain-containing protein [Prevotellaceae bacterium]
MKRKLLPFFILSVLLFWGCNPSDCVTDTLALISLQDEYVEFDPSGETIIVPIYSLLAWKVISKPDWVSVDPMNGPGGVDDTDITLIAEENDTGASREDKVVIVDTAGNQLIIYVFQPAPRPVAATLTVTPPTLYFEHDQSGVGVGTDNLTITTNQTLWTASGIPGWLTLSVDTGGSGTTTISVYPKADNTGSTPLTATITITAGVLTETFTVIQDIDPATITDGGTLLPNSYVGAYWRATETGERIIRIANITDPAHIGKWKASVLWMDATKWAADDIVLDTDLLDAASLADRGIDFSSVIAKASISNAEDYQLLGTAQTVNGNVASGGDILFRIGIKSTFTAFNSPNNAARYAVVLLSYNLDGLPKHQKIFIRQGHGMGLIHSGTSSYQYYYINPYNTGSYSNFTLYGGFNKMVDYPTKAGYFYQWGYGTPSTPVSYPPQDPIISPAWIVGEDPYNRAHGSEATPFFVCTSTPNRGDMIGTSIFSSISSADANMDHVFGFYADGFFDRSMIVTSVTGEPLSTVSAGNDDVAYRGRLFFNTVTHASLFFPAAGFRSSADGTLHNAGSSGWYLSRNFDGATNAYYMLLNSSTFSVESSLRSNGYSIRCVYDMI